MLALFNFLILKNKINIYIYIYIYIYVVCLKYIKELLKLFNSDDVTEGSIKEHKPNWSQIPDHFYRL